ncbi:hypothetical protein HS7_12510 [Sulfolobales archaeon HS-7]|nr:hypothetical protein HS7_12510 [Sulfolobales archaeon HS-7]
MQLKEKFSKDPVKYAFEIYDMENESKYTEFIIHREGYLMFYRRFKHPNVILEADEEETLTYLISKISESKYILFTDPKWLGVVREKIPNAKIYGEILMICENPKAFPDKRVRRLSSDDLELTPYSGKRLEFLSEALSAGKTTVYGAFVDERFVSVAYTWIETESVAYIGGVLTEERYRNRGLAKAVVSAIANDIVKRGKIASLYVRDDNIPAIKAYEAVGFKARGRRLWVDVNTGESP